LLGGFIVGSNQLREKYLPMSYELEVQKLKDAIKDKTISVTVDETTDSKSRKVVNILFSYDRYTKLASTEFLEKADAKSISQTVMNILHFYNISYNNVIFFISDNASYMKLAYSFLSPFLPNMFHNCCLAHIFNLVGDCWTNFEKFEIVDFFVANFKSLFTYSNYRKKRWIEHLENNNIMSPTLPPVPVKSRWNSWFNFLIWIQPHFHLIESFIESEVVISEETKSLRNLKGIFNDPDRKIYLEIIINFIKFNSSR
jgi:hypothetical protein